MSYIQLHNVCKQFGAAGSPAVNNVSLSMAEGSILTLLGPSGCGKTTTLRMIAGFERPTSGTIRIAGETVCSDTFSLPAEKRGIGMVFQDYALFPHLTVEKNVAFGLNKWGRKERRERTLEVLELVGLANYATRYPYELSGGQQQRVSLARALAPKPKVLLLDEPFSNLDVKLREKMREEVNDILRKSKTTSILVTHDQKDAFAISDVVVVMNQGHVQQIASPRQLYQQPKNCFVAEFLGKTNLLTGKLDSDNKHVFTRIGKVCLPDCTTERSDDVTVSIRPEGCRIRENGRYCGVVEQITYYGEYQEVSLRFHSSEAPQQKMVIYAPVENDLSAGSRVSFDIAPELVSLVSKV